MNENVSFETTGLHAAGFDLHPDGRFQLGLIPGDQNSTIEDTRVDEFTIDKLPGQPLKIACPRGFLTATYAQGRWTVLSNLPEINELAAKYRRDNAPAPSPPYEDETPYPIPGPVQRPAAQRNTAGIIATAFVFAIVAIAALFAFRPYIRKILDQRDEEIRIAAEQAKAHRTDEERKAKYQALDDGVRPLYTEAKKNLAAFDTLAATVFKEVENLAHRSLDQLTAEPPDVSQEIRDAYRFVDEFQRPWNQLLNAYTTTKELRDSATLADLSRRIEQGSLREGDRTELPDFIKSIEDAHATISAQRENVDAVRRILAQRERDALAPPRQRSSP